MIIIEKCNYINIIIITNVAVITIKMELSIIIILSCDL